jgi:Alcohol acetyltransferase
MVRVELHSTDVLPRALCQPSSAEVKSTVQTTKPPMLPELEQLHESSSSGSRLGSTEAETKPSQTLGEAWAGGSQSLPVESRFRSVIINTETSDNLASQCRANGTSVTATTQALVSAILFEVLPETFTALNSDCAISVRRWLHEPITNDSMGCFVGSFSQTHERKDFTWDEARRCRQTILEIMAEQGLGQPFGDPQGMAADLKYWFESKIGRPRMSAFELSNVGRLAGSDRLDLYKVRTLLFSQSAGATSGAIKISQATGPDGRLTIGLSWQQGIVSEGVIAHLALQLPKRLDALASSSHTG